MAAAPPYTGGDLGHFDCDLYNPTVGPKYVECTDLKVVPGVDYHCTHFILTATAPAPGETGTGTVAGKVDCDSPDDLKTAHVLGTGIATADNTLSSPPVDLGYASKVRCYALGADDNLGASGTWEVDCWEPGFKNPFE
jgi:hypothetical protein